MKRKACLLATLVLVGFAATLHAQGVDVGNVVANEFGNAIRGFGTQITAYAERLFWSLTAISLVWTGATLALRKADLGDFASELLRFIVATGFFYWILKNGADMAISIIDGLQQAGANVGGSNGASQATTIMQLCMNVANAAMNNVSFLDWKFSVFWALVALVVVLIGCYVIVTTTIALCSALLLIYAGIFVLGFGGSRWTSEIAISYYKAVIGAGLRLFTINLLMNTAVRLVQGATTRGLPDFGTALYVLAYLVIVAMLIDKMPPVIANLVSGNHIGAPGSAMGTLTGAASLGVQAAAAVASGGASIPATTGGAAVRAAAARAVEKMNK